MLSNWQQILLVILNLLVVFCAILVVTTWDMKFVVYGTVFAAMSGVIDAMFFKKLQ